MTELVAGWIYDMADYRRMFDLNDSELASTILDYPASISSFNAEMQKKGYSVQSGDAHYQMSIDEMRAYSQTIFDANAAHLKRYAGILRPGQDIASILSEWERRRDLFLQDYETGKKEHRYQYMDLPGLPFDNQIFDIALCSDHLFHSQVIQQGKYLAVIAELCRVAKEVRVFPLQDEQGKMTDSLGHLMLEMQQKDCGIEVREVAYHEMKGGNAMLRIWSTKCVIDS